MNPEENAANTPIKVSSWPGGFGIYKASKEAMATNLWTYVAVLLLSIGFSVVPDLFAENSLSTTGALVLNLIATIISVFLGLAGIVIVLKNTERQKISIDESLAKSLPLVINYIVMSIATAVLLVLSVIALIIPAFFVFPRLLLAQYFLVDKKMGPIESIAASWKATKGHVGKVYGTIGVFIAITFLAITIIGIPFAIYFYIMYSAAQPLLYRYVTSQQAITE